MGFNPCSDGRFPTVRIIPRHFIAFLCRFNPCSDGRFPTVLCAAAITENVLSGFNPCSDGRFPTVRAGVSNGLDGDQVSILVLMEDSRRSIKACGVSKISCPSGFNPCSDGRFPTVHKRCGRRSRAHPVSILVLMEDSRRYAREHGPVREIASMTFQSLF